MATGPECRGSGSQLQLAPQFRDFGAKAEPQAPTAHQPPTWSSVASLQEAYSFRDVLTLLLEAERLVLRPRLRRRLQSRSRVILPRPQSTIKIPTHNPQLADGVLHQSLPVWRSKYAFVQISSSSRAELVGSKPRR